MIDLAMKQGDPEGVARSVSACAPPLILVLLKEKLTMKKKFLWCLVTLTCVNGLIGCGGGSSSPKPITAYSISGTVTSGSAGLPSATMIVTGAKSMAVMTDANGNYSIMGLSDGPYTITPSKTNYTFSSTSKTVTIAGANSSGHTFTATPQSPTVSMYKSAGSRQCEGGGISLAVMQLQLTDAGIEVLDASCGFDGFLRPTVCGASDGRVGIFEIPAAQEQTASTLGFQPLSNLPDPTKGACQ